MLSITRTYLCAFLAGELILGGVISQAAAAPHIDDDTIKLPTRTGEAATPTPGRGFSNGSDQPSPGATPRGGECCEGALCDGDANGDGVVDPLDSGYVLSRFGLDPTVGDNCTADVNCDGVIDPLDSGYVLSRFGTCDEPNLCAPGGGECGGVVDKDMCEGALELFCGDSDTIVGDDFISEGDEPVSSCEIANGGPYTKSLSVWYLVTTSLDTTDLTIDLCGSENDADNDTVVTIFTAGSTCANLAEKDCDDDACTFPAFGPSSVTTEVEPTTSYIVLMDVYAPSDSGATYTTSVICE